MGTPKQLLPYKQTTLLEHSIEEALASKAGQLVVVLGAHAEMVRPAVREKKLSVIINKSWQEGMSSSIRCGLQYLLEEIPAVQSALFMACDQPYISAVLLNKLVTLQQQTGRAIVASQYAATTGIPAIFDKQLFPGLLALEGDSGAKKLILQHQYHVATVPFPLGNIDIDTAADADRMQKR